ncbi:replicative DNA helicase [Oceanobacillus limi]|uniref:Replicative DNA helicase n=1 Tax=Oceanobacillus limi TaxID=930131 RepID=A0A1H9Y0F7_9BACI|nr:replicative DNA helicase [Oceanobacillus limi]SES62110.1 replicative DNA helicase [Oceanobacillus limi]
MKTENFEAEATVLGAVILDGTLFSELIVNEMHFHYAAHQKIYQAMKRAVDHGEFIDMVVVTTYLGKGLDEVGGTMYLLEMVESVASTAGLKHHERLILDAYRNRETRKQVLAYASDPSDQELELLIRRLQDFQRIGGKSVGKSTYDHLLEITEEMCFPSDETTGFLTTYHELDAMTGGLQRGDLIIVAARPSVGKTAFALNLAAGHCRNGGTSAIFSLEMGTKQLLQRMISAEGRIDSQKWRSMAFSTKDYGKAMGAIGAISDWRLKIHDQKRTVMEIRTAIRKMVHDHPDERHVAIIDYLQLISPAVRRDRRDLEVGEITRELKLLAMEMNIPIVLLSQLSRGVESRQDKRPVMSDLRESGNIEQDADVISFLYRDDYYNRRTDDADRVEIIIGKQRNGPVGTVRMVFRKEFGVFEGEVQLVN